MKLLAVVFLFLPMLAIAQDIYKWKDDKGQWNFSQTPPLEKKADRAQTQPPEKQKNRDSPELVVRKKLTEPPAPPYIELYRTEHRVMEKNESRWKLSWKAHIWNRSEAPARFAVSFHFLDHHGFIVERDLKAGLYLAPNEGMVVDGTKLVAKTSAKIAKSTAEIRLH